MKFWFINFISRYYRLGYIILCLVNVIRIILIFRGLLIYLSHLHFVRTGCLKVDCLHAVQSYEESYDSKFSFCCIKLSYKSLIFMDSCIVEYLCVQLWSGINQFPFDFMIWFLGVDLLHALLVHGQSLSLVHLLNLQI